MSDPSRANNRCTLQAYERHARGYAAAVSAIPSPSGAEALRRLAAALAPGQQVLEIGSGPGWDADFLEALGLRVHRTDATAAFRQFQAERGNRVEPLDLLRDDIVGRYDGVLMLCVLQHFERVQLDAALGKLARALRGGGALLLSYPQGSDECWERTQSGDYRVVRWMRVAMDARLARSGFAVDWDACSDGEDGPWRDVLARRLG